MDKDKEYYMKLEKENMILKEMILTTMSQLEKFQCFIIMNNKY